MTRVVIIRFCIISGDKNTVQLASKLIRAAKSGLAFLGRNLRGHGWEIEMHDADGEYRRFSLQNKLKEKAE